MPQGVDLRQEAVVIPDGLSATQHNVHVLFQVTKIPLVAALATRPVRARVGVPRSRRSAKIVMRLFYLFLLALLAQFFMIGLGRI